MRKAISFLFLLLVIQIPFLAEDFNASAGNFVSDTDSLSTDSISTDSILTDSIPVDTILQDTILQDTIPQDTIPQDTIPQDTIPQDTIPQDTIPQDTIPQDTIPQDTIPQAKIDSIAKAFKQGVLTRAYLPFSVDTSQIQQLYRPIRIDDSLVTIYPVSYVPAGEPFVGLSHEDIDEWVIANSLTDWTPPMEKPVAWDGGTIKGNLEDFSWYHTTMDGHIDSLKSTDYQILDLQELHFNVNLENVQVRRYLQQVHYTDSTPSEIYNYRSKPFVKGDSPNPVSIPFPPTDQDTVTVVCTNMEDACETVSKRISSEEQMARIYNLTPQQDYSYSVYAADSLLASGTFHTDGHIRMIHAPGVNNIRDLGGWQTSDGRQIRYGKLYRGSELNGLHEATPEAIQALLDIGIQAEIDMRHSSESGSGISVFGFIGSDYDAPDGLKTYYYTNNSGCEVSHMSGSFWQSKWRQEFNYIVANLKLNRPVYYHCIWGADRTGFLSMLLEGVLGITYDNIAKDYELTSFTAESARLRENQYTRIEYINALEGNTLQEKFHTYLTQQIHISQENIDYLTETMLTKDKLTLNITQHEFTNAHASVKEGIYDLQGRKQTGLLPKGIYIEIKKDGTVRKFMQQ